MLRSSARAGRNVLLTTLVAIVLVFASMTIHGGRSLATAAAPSRSSNGWTKSSYAAWPSSTYAPPQKVAYGRGGSNAGTAVLENNLPATLAMMTSDEGRLAAVKGYVGRLAARGRSQRPLGMGDLSSALCFFTSEPNRIEAVRLLATQLSPADADADPSGVIVFFTTDDGRTKAVEAIRGAR